jgi:hypothetical protein
MKNIEKDTHVLKRRLDISPATSPTKTPTPKVDNPSIVAINNFVDQMGAIGLWNTE